MSHGKAVQLMNKSEWTSFLDNNKGRLAVVDFFATWCGPCRMMAPKFAALSEQHADVAFASVDVDGMDQDIIRQCEVSAMPTFQFYRDGKKIDEIVGANPGKLEALIKQYK